MQKELASIDLEKDLDFDEVAPLVEFFLLIKARPMRLADIFQYVKSIPGVTPAKLLNLLRTNSATSGQFISDCEDMGPGRMAKLSGRLSYKKFHSGP